LATHSQQRHHDPPRPVDQSRTTLPPRPSRHRRPNRRHRPNHRPTTPDLTGRPHEVWMGWSVSTSTARARVVASTAGGTANAVSSSSDQRLGRLLEARRGGFEVRWPAFNRRTSAAKSSCSSSAANTPRSSRRACGTSRPRARPTSLRQPPDTFLIRAKDSPASRRSRVLGAILVLPVIGSRAVQMLADRRHTSSSTSAGSWARGIPAF
jgi:hypothetical protein